MNIIRYSTCFLTLTEVFMVIYLKNLFYCLSGCLPEIIVDLINTREFPRAIGNSQVTYVMPKQSLKSMKKIAVVFDSILLACTVS